MSLDLDTLEARLNALWGVGQIRLNVADARVLVAAARERDALREAILTTVDEVTGDHVCSCGHHHAPLLGGTERLLGLE